MRMKENSITTHLNKSLASQLCEAYITASVSLARMALVDPANNNLNSGFRENKSRAQSRP